MVFQLRSLNGTLLKGDVYVTRFIWKDGWLLRDHTQKLQSILLRLLFRAVCVVPGFLRLIQVQVKFAASFRQPNHSFSHSSHPNSHSLTITTVTFRHSYTLFPLETQKIPFP